MILRTPRRLFAAGLVLAVASAALLFVPDRGAPAAAFDPMDDYCLVAPALPYDARSGLAVFDPRPLPAHARCPVCGMYPARFPRWAAQTIFRDGAVHFFDSPVNLHLFLADVSRYNRAYESADVVVSFVTDVEDGRWIEAGQAYYVHGSNALGPMRGGNLPAFASREAAQRFAEARGGDVIGAAELTADLLRGFVHGGHHH
ncbi:MAG TPA: nitrous oxide reductase accessory protein NosL [Rhodocyclaceae bacterium]|nr:nitrous oxide reductase accessory protein NosL [Rhodocyclaceae bacterium]